MRDLRCGKVMRPLKVISDLMLLLRGKCKSPSQLSRNSFFLVGLQIVGLSLCAALVPLRRRQLLSDCGAAIGGFWPGVGEAWVWSRTNRMETKLGSSESSGDDADALSERESESEKLQGRRIAYKETGQLLFFFWYSDCSLASTHPRYSTRKREKGKQRP